jgi:hypothetical protein
MARQLIHGFEGGTYLDKASNVSGTPVITSGTGSYGFTGNYFLNLSDGRIQHNLTAKDYYYMSFRVYFGSSSYTNTTCLRFYNGTTCLGALKLDISTDGYAKIYRGDGSNLIATGTYRLVTLNCYRVEVYYKPSTGVSGDFSVRINGIADITQTGVQTANNTGQVNLMQFGFGGGSMYIDDIVADDASWIGNTRIQGLQPTAVGNSNSFTSYPSGDNYTTVDEIPYSDADYNYSNTVDHLDLFGMSNLDESLKTVNTIKCLDIIVRAKIDGFATPTEIAVAQRTGSTNYAGTDQIVAQDSWGFYHQIYEVNPNTSVAYVKADINGIELGYKARS